MPPVVARDPRLPEKSTLADIGDHSDVDSHEFSIRSMQAIPVMLPQVQPKQDITYPA